jgi:hypothetical protein
MAILMTDCLRTLARAELARELSAASEKTPDLDKKAFLVEFFGRNPGLEDYLRLR